MTSKIAVTHPSLTDQAGKERRLPFLIEARPESADTPLNELLDWITEIKAWREAQLHRVGAILFRGFTAIRTAEDFAGVVQRMAPEIPDYAGVTTLRSAVTGKIVTSTNAPRHVVIGLHQEMSYLAPSQKFPDPAPDKVMFFCATASGGGGQTQTADMRWVYRKLPREWVMKPFIRDRFYYHSTFADGSEISEKGLDTIRSVIDEEMVLFDWQRGDVLLIDNKLVSHGRQPYSPPRTIYAALLADQPRRSAA